MPKLFDEANREYYKTIDWALDISKAEFIESDFRGIPSKLIRHDPETQIVVTRKKALEGEWRKLDLSATYWPAYLEYIIKHNEEDVMMAAPKAHPRFWALLDGLKKLREAGIAEPD